MAVIDNAGDLCSYAEAMAHPDAAEWEMACEAEKRAFEHMGVYEVVPCPKGRKVVGSRWVFRIKRGPDGTILKYKARIVTQGFTQIEGVDYDETFTPVAKHTSLCVILALTAEHNLLRLTAYYAQQRVLCKTRTRVLKAVDEDKEIGNNRQ